MNDVPAADPFAQREILVNALYEAAELEHNLMCTYIYAAASLKDGEGEGLTPTEAAAVKRWQQVLLAVAIQEMGHLAAVWNITGEPPAGQTDMLPVRDGVLAIDPQSNGPLRVRGNLEIITATGRVVSRVTSTYLCRCGGSANKPFCDGTHAKIGFRSD